VKTPAAFPASMSKGESPMKAASAGNAPASSSARNTGSGCGLWSSVSSVVTTTSK
jgi:hypothetical protein